jgi:hypothetical protein
MFKSFRSRQRAGRASRKNAFLLEVERLERRWVPSANNVTATVSGGNLEIRTDDNSNDRFTVSQTGNTITVTGYGSTTINGGAPGGPLGASVTLSGPIKNADISLADGNDDVIVYSLTVAGNFQLHAGNGDDWVDIVGDYNGVSVGGNFQLQTGDGSDTVNVGYAEGSSVSVGRNFQVQTGNGSDLVEICESFGATLSAGGNFHVQTGDGNDYVVVGFEGTVTVGGNFQLQAGDGNDGVIVENVTANANFQIQIGNGTNLLRTYHNSAGRNFQIQYGPNTTYDRY